MTNNGNIDPNLQTDCPACGALPTLPCVDEDGEEFGGKHLLRVIKAEGLDEEEVFRSLRPLVPGKALIPREGA